MSHLSHFHKYNIYFVVFPVIVGLICLHTFTFTKDTMYFVASPVIVHLTCVLTFTFTKDTMLFSGHRSSPGHKNESGNTRSGLEISQIITCTSKGAILGTCDLSDIWSDWWGDMTWPKKINLPTYLPTYLHTYLPVNLPKRTTLRSNPID